MKKNVWMVALFFNVSALSAQDKPKNTKVEEVKPICQGLSKAEKPVVAVLPFKMDAAGAAQEAGTGLPDMLLNALFGTGCFRIVERDRMKDIMTEQGLGISGAGDPGTFAQIGKMIGAQVLVSGSITEFKENESGGGGGLGSVFRRGNGIGAIIGAGKSNTSHIGYILKFLDPSTGEVLAIKSFDKKKTSIGLAAGGLFGGSNSISGGGGGFYKSKSMQDAIEESLIEAVEYMSQNKSAFTGIAGSNKTAESNVTKGDCALLKSANKPAIVVVLPEEHIAGAGSNYDPYRGGQLYININKDAGGMGGYISTAPCEAGQTEISRKLTEFGFRLKDASQLEKLKTDKSFQNAFNSASDASLVGARYKVDIIIVGDAFSEYSKNSNGMVSCRATVNIKAVMTKDASIIATQSFKGSGLDATEIVAGKTAIQNASSQIADYLLNQLCLKTDDISSSMGKPKGGGAAIATNESDIKFNHVDFTKANSLNKIIAGLGGVSKVERVSFAGEVAKFHITHTGDLNALVEKITNNKAGIKLNVLSVEDSTADVDVK